MNSPLFIRTDGITSPTHADTRDAIRERLGACSVEFLLFHVDQTGADVHVWFDEDAEGSQSPNIFASLLVKELCRSSREFFEYQPALHGPIVISDPPQDFAPTIGLGLDPATARLFYDASKLYELAAVW